MKLDEPLRPGGSRNICDNETCRKVLTFLVYRGKQGEYCSNQCLEAKEIDVKKKKTLRPATTADASPKPTETPAKESKADAPAPVKLKKKLKAAEEAPTPAKAGKTPAKAASKAAAAPTKAEGPYRPGSATAAVYALLKDGKTHLLEDVYKASEDSGAKYPKDAIWFIADRGKKTGEWAVVKDKEKGTVKLTVAK